MRPVRGQGLRTNSSQGPSPLAFIKIWGEVGKCDFEEMLIKIETVIGILPFKGNQ